MYLKRILLVIAVILFSAGCTHVEVYCPAGPGDDPSDDPCSITLTYPNGGETWLEGSSQTITWTSAGTCNDFVEVELHRAGSPCIYIDNHVPNTGSFTWDAVVQCWGHIDDYRILVYDRVNDAGDTSNSTFNILPEEEACAIINGDFSAGDVVWVNDSEGPGLGSGVQEIIDVDGRSHVLHLDSRAGGNYYLFRTQWISLGSCDITQMQIHWDWRLAQIQPSYGLAAVYFMFYDHDYNYRAAYFVRRHTGDFAPYFCGSLVQEFIEDNPGVGVGCEELIGTSFGWQTKLIEFNEAFFGELEGAVVDPAGLGHMKIFIESYNNAGSGVDAYFDDFVLE